MFKRMAGWIVTWQIDRQILERRDESLYLFAYESMIGQLANILIAILIAFVFHSWLPVVCFLTAYIPLRSYAGGYHADSHGRCCVVSAVILVLISGFDKVLSGAFFMPLGICALMISGAAVYGLAPVADHNKPLDEEERKRYQMKSREIWTAEELGMALCAMLHMGRVCNIISASLLLTALMLVIGKMKNEHL